MTNNDTKNINHDIINTNTNIDHAFNHIHRDEEDLLQDYDTVLNHAEMNQDDTGTVILLYPIAEQKPLRQCSKLIVRDTAATAQNNIYLAHQLLCYYETVHA